MKVRLCLGLEKPGPTGPWSSEIGALVDGRRSLGAAAMFDGIEFWLNENEEEKISEEEEEGFITRPSSWHSCRKRVGIVVLVAKLVCGVVVELSRPALAQVKLGDRQNCNSN